MKIWEESARETMSSTERKNLAQMGWRPAMASSHARTCREAVVSPPLRSGLVHVICGRAHQIFTLYRTKLVPGLED